MIKIPDFKLKAVKNEQGEMVEPVSNQQVFFNVLDKAVGGKYEKGIADGDRRVWGKIQRKFDEVIDQKLEEVDLNEMEVTWLKTAFSGTNFPKEWANFSVLVEDSLVSVEK